VDGRKGAQCKITSITEESVQDVIRKLKKLREWAEYFEIPTCLSTIIENAEKGPGRFPLMLPIDEDGKRVPQRVFL
jgi:hypothetical protein